MLIDTPYARPPYVVLFVPTSEGTLPPPPKAETPVATTTSAKSKAIPALPCPFTRRAPYANACMSRPQGTRKDKRQALGCIGVWSARTVMVGNEYTWNGMSLGDLEPGKATWDPEPLPSSWRPSPCRRCRGSPARGTPSPAETDRKSTRLNSSHVKISYAVFCLKKKKISLFNFMSKNRTRHNVPVIR